MAARGYKLSHLDELEAEAIHIIREVVAEFERPVMLYSVGKDSSCMLQLARKAFAPAPLPFPLLHISTTFQFQEMYEFRDRVAAEIGAELRVFTNPDGQRLSMNPRDFGTQKCCSVWRTRGVVAGIKEGGYDAIFGGARRDEEKSRAKERVYSLRNPAGQWDPKNQRPELWHLFNGRINPGESVRVFPLSNWTELDVWHYIYREEIPLVSLYLAADRQVVEQDGQLIPLDPRGLPQAGREIKTVRCRFRSLGCVPCTGAVRSEARSVAEVIEELLREQQSERANRVIDHDQEGSMELKKREGYF